MLTKEAKCKPFWETEATGLLPKEIDRLVAKQ